MAAKVTLAIVQGKLQGREFVFEERDTCIVGRADECRPQLPDDTDHRTISRHHCLLDINPPDIRIRDFGSLNGTYVNRKKIGQRQPDQTPEEGAQLQFPEHDLQDGDEILLGDTVFRVAIEAESAAETLFRNDEPQNQNSDRVGKLLAEANRAGRELENFGNYRLVKELGEGGCSKVYLAIPADREDPVALKVMRPEVAVRPRMVDRFLREVNISRALKHQNIVNTLDCGQDRGVFFLSLEYCEGGSLSDYLQQQDPPLPVDESLEIIFQVLDGLDYAHNLEFDLEQKDGTVSKAQGLVHRDLKPGNILFKTHRDRRVVKVADYGLAKAFDLAGLSGLTCTGQRAGTPFFCPRQQVIDFKYAQKDVDVWATAATLYFMLTGYPPRDFSPDRDVFKTILSTRAIPIRKRNPALSKRLSDTIDRALVDNPGIPFSTAKELKAALQSAIA